MQPGNFRNLKRVIFTHWKDVESWLNAFWYCFPVIKSYLSLFDEIGSHTRKPELFWNIAIVWYIVLLKFSDIII